MLYKALISRCTIAMVIVVMISLKLGHVLFWMALECSIDLSAEMMYVDLKAIFWSSTGVEDGVITGVILQVF